MLVLVLAIEGQLFRWEMARSSLSTASREEVVRDARFQRFAWATRRSRMRSKRYGFAGVAYVAVTGSTFLARAD